MELSTAKYIYKVKRYIPGLTDVICVCGKR